MVKLSILKVFQPSHVTAHSIFTKKIIIFMDECLSRFIMDASPLAAHLGIHLPDLELGTESIVHAAISLLAIRVI